MGETRVGLVCGYLDPSRDGVADYTRRLADSLREIRIEPVLVTAHGLAAGEAAVGVTERWDALGVLRAARAVRRLDVDLVHVQFAPSVFGFSRAVGMLPRWLPSRVPLVVTLHEYGVWAGRGLGRRIRSNLWSVAEHHGYVDRETLFLTTAADVVLVPSREHLCVLQKRLRRHAPVTLEVPIGLNVEGPAVGEMQARADVRRVLGVAPGAALVVFFGFLHPAKALDQLISAVADVQAQHPGTHLLLIGGAESHSVTGTAAHQFRRQLDQVAAACGVQDNVHFTGYLPDSKVSRLMRAADVAAFPFHEGVTRKSSSLLAAFAAGIPVVATAPPGELRRPTEDQAVLRVPPNDTAALAAALEMVLSDRALADRLAAAAGEVLAAQSWDAIASAHAEVYARVLASRRTLRA